MHLRGRYTARRTAARRGEAMQRAVEVMLQLHAHRYAQQDQDHPRVAVRADARDAHGGLALHARGRPWDAHHVPLPQRMDGCGWSMWGVALSC